MLTPDCVSERAALRVLGYTQTSWDNESGEETQPWVGNKYYWNRLSKDERAAVVVLGYTETTWDNRSGLEPQPASASKKWAEMTVCPGGEDPSTPHAPFAHTLSLSALSLLDDSDI